MANQILVDISTLQNTKSSYNARRTEMNNALNDVTKAVNSLSSVWQGKAATQFRTRYTTLKANLAMTDKAMQDALKDLQTTIDATNKVEQSGSSAANALDVGDKNYF